MTKNQKGVAYLGLLFAVALGGIALAGSSIVWQLEARREKEKQLLFVGEEYRRAITSYYDRSPNTPQFPNRLADLILDPRFPMPVRHLRRLYPEPMMSDGQWQLIRQQGGIIGVASRSLDEPIKVGGFPEVQAEFEGAKRYVDWQFVARPGSTRPQGNTAGDGVLPH